MHPLYTKQEWQHPYVAKHIKKCVIEQMLSSHKNVLKILLGINIERDLGVYRTNLKIGEDAGSRSM